MAITKDNSSGSEFFFNAWNGTKGYTLDLNLETLLGNWIGTDPAFGQTSASTLAAAAVPTTQYNASGVLFDGELTEFASAFGNDFTDVEWSLVAYDNVAVNRVIVTADSAATLAEVSNDKVKNLANTLDNMATQVNNQLAPTAAADTFVATEATDGAAYAGQFGSTYKGNVFDTTNTLGTTSSLYMLAQSSSNSANANQDGVLKQVATVGGVNLTATTYQENGVWKLKIEAAGATDGTLADGTPAPVAFTSSFAQAEIFSITQLSDTQYVIVGNNGVNEVVDNPSSIVFTDGTLALADIATSTAFNQAPVFNTNNGAAAPTKYVGAVEFLEWQFLGAAAGDVVTGSTGNDFMNLLEGDDAANGGDGQDVLDGGLGSNFLTGGAGNDVFFLDGRGTGSTTWSTITDFTAGDNVNIWGWVEGTSQLLLTQESAGAVGFEGITNHYDLDNDGNIDTSITFTGLTEIPANSPQVVAENGYLLFA